MMKKNGFAAAGFVGLLSLALMVGIGGFALYTANGNSRTSSQTQASRNEVRDVDLGLKITVTYSSGKTNLKLDWTGVKDPDPCKKEDCPKYTIGVMLNDGRSERLNDSRVDRIVRAEPGQTSFSKEIMGMELRNGSYYVSLRYVPPSYAQNPVVRREIQHFNVEYKKQIVMDRNCANAGFYEDVNGKRPSNGYNVDNPMNSATEGSAFIAYAVDVRRTPNTEKIHAVLSVPTGILKLNAVDSDSNCKWSGPKFQCVSSGAVRYKIGKVAEGFRGNIELNYTSDQEGETQLKCGPYLLDVVGRPPP